ncbi:MAG: diaminopimelate epimerase [Lachnospiraceae bacterium]|nr:diaminopimelate epimerase [Lachnospiraceae bacterium]
MFFTKMQGCGNDYIYVDGAKEKTGNRSELAVKLSDRHFGIGSDGIIFIDPCDEADFEMHMFNADGSEAQMCGNGIRCVGKFVYDEGMIKKDTVSIKTGAGIKELELFAQNGEVRSVRVDMGVPVFEPEQIPTTLSGDRIISYPVVIGGDEYRITCLSMGNPHCVVFVDDVEYVEIETTGPLFESNEIFPERINTEFVRVVDRNNIEMRVWERGSGETLACGTGACASAVACVLNDLTDRKTAVKLTGGTLDIEYAQDGHVYMTGPAVTVYEGEICLK